MATGLTRQQLKQGLIGLVLIGSLWFFLSYRLREIPPGINKDEASIGYNAALLAKDLKDETGRKLPVFILTLDGSDWKQPINIYAAAIFFKVWGKTIYQLRMVSVVWGIVATLGLWLVLRLWVKPWLAVWGCLILVMAPQFLLQAHLALENMAVLPFMIWWLYFLAAGLKKEKSWLFLAAGCSLGLGFYAYRGMHGLVPIYAGLSLGYLVKTYWQQRAGWKFLAWFLVGLSPFLAPVPVWDKLYAGAVVDRTAISQVRFYQAAEVYLAAFNPAFVFVKGDSVLVHATKPFGMVVLPVAALVVLGLYQAGKEKQSFYRFCGWCLLATPVILIPFESVDRASRLMAYLPLLAIFAVLGLKLIVERQTKVKFGLIVGLAVWVVIGGASFSKYYWTQYPQKLSQEFKADWDRGAAELAKEAKRLEKRPYLEEGIYQEDKAVWQYLNQAYFEGQVGLWNQDKESMPKNAVSLTLHGPEGDLVNRGEVPTLVVGQHKLYLVSF